MIAEFHQAKAKNSSLLPILAVANIHPDYIEACLEDVCTGSRCPPRLPPGTITFVRQTAGYKGNKAYGVRAVWYYDGKSDLVPRVSQRWPAKWAWKVTFRPLIERFANTFCEEFTEDLPPGMAGRGHKGSRHVSGLVYTKLQGTIVKIPPYLAVPYIRALLKARKNELESTGFYLGQEIRVATILRRLANKIARTPSSTLSG